VKVTCAICARRRDESSCKAIPTTKADRAQLLKMGEKTPQVVYHYCRPCLRILENPATALDLLRGMMRIYAQAAGASNPDQIASKYKSQLAAKIPRHKPS